MLEVHLKGFGCKRLNLIEFFLTWFLCFFALLFVTFVFVFFLFLGLALHNIHAFYSRIVFVSSFQKEKKKEKENQNVFCIIFLGFEIKVGQFIFT